MSTPNAFATCPQVLRPLSGAAPIPDLEAVVDRELTAWAHQNAEAEEAAFDFEEIACSAPAVLDAGEWQYLRMEAEVDPNELVHDRYSHTSLRAA